MQTVIWCVICGIITAGSLCAALGAEKRAQEAEARIEAAGYFYKVQKEIADKALGVSQATIERSSALMVALKNETAERARIERASCGVLEKNEALERRVEELEAELAKKQKVLDYIADAEKEDAV